jgi:copper(I)-binding protein
VNRGGRKVTRWNRRLLFGAMVVLVPALAGCEAGFNAPTLQYHPANFTGDTTKNGISFSNVFVLGAAPNGPAVAGGRTGVFMSLYSTDGDQLRSVSAEVASQASILGGPVSLPADSLVDLSGPVPKVVLSGLANPLQGGQTVTIDFRFAKAGTITIDVPVEPQSFEFGTYSPPPTPSPSPSATGKKKKAKGSASASASASPSTTP